MTTTPAMPTLDHGTKLAVDRTWLAHERTLMAWVRTSTSLVSFGFTFYKFFQLEMRRGPTVEGAIGAREFALLLIVVGLAGLILAVVQHRASVKAMKATYGNIVPRSVAEIAAGMVAMLGIVAIVAVILRM